MQGKCIYDLRLVVALIKWLVLSSCGYGWIKQPTELEVEALNV